MAWPRQAPGGRVHRTAGDPTPCCHGDAQRQPHVYRYSAKQSNVWPQCYADERRRTDHGHRHGDIARVRHADVQPDRPGNAHARPDRICDAHRAGRPDERASRHGDRAGGVPHSPTGGDGHPAAGGDPADARSDRACRDARADPCAGYRHPAAAAHGHAQPAAERHPGASHRRAHAPTHRPAAGDADDCSHPHAG